MSWTRMECSSQVDQIYVVPIFTIHVQLALMDQTNSFLQAQHELLFYPACSRLVMSPHIILRAMYCRHTLIRNLNYDFWAKSPAAESQTTNKWTLMIESWPQSLCQRNTGLQTPISSSYHRNTALQTPISSSYHRNTALQTPISSSYHMHATGRLGVTTIGWQRFRRKTIGQKQKQMDVKETTCERLLTVHLLEQSLYTNWNRVYAENVVVAEQLDFHTHWISGVSRVFEWRGEERWRHRLSSSGLSCHYKVTSLS